MSVQLTKLGEVADIQLGITLRGSDASRHDPAGTHRLIRISDLSDDGSVSFGEPSLIKLSPTDANRYEVKPGEVLLAARGTRMTAAVFYGGDGPCVVGGQFLVIRPRNHAIEPEYLRWYLNLPSIQEKLLSFARGSYVRSLPAKDLVELEIPLPPLAHQHAVAELNRLRIREKELMLRLAEKRGTYVDHSVLQHFKH